MPAEDTAAFVAGLLIDEELADPPGTFSMSLRLPVTLAASLIVMAEQGGKSRNEMARMIIQAGLDDIFSRLPVEVAGDLHEAIRERATDLL